MDVTKKRKLDENGVLLPDSDTKLTVDDARKIIEPFTHSQLLEIVQSAAVKHLDVLDAVRSIADHDPSRRKLFIRGLGWDTTTDNLRSLFSAYGELEEAIVILDKSTGKSKGFGFITFKHTDGALLALKEPSKKIDGRMTVTQLAAGPSVNSQAMDVSERKIYVGNVPSDMAAERLLAHFSSYGEIEEGPLGFDKATGKFKGYALFVYKNAEAARASLVDPIKNIDGQQLNCKLANDGKRGKPGAAVGGGTGGAQPLQGPNGAPVEPHGSNGNGIGPIGLHSQSSMPSQYGGVGGPNGVSSYSGFSGGLHHPTNSSSSLGGGPGQAPSSLGASGGYGSGFGGPYGGSHFGGPGLTGYGGGAGGGLGSVGGVLGGALGSAGTGFGGSSRGSSLYGLPPSSMGMPSGGYPESTHYSLSSSGFQSQHHQMEGPPLVPRIPPGRMFHGGPPYY